MNWEGGRAASILGMLVSNFQNSVLQRIPLSSLRGDVGKFLKAVYRVLFLVDD